MTSNPALPANGSSHNKGNGMWAGLPADVPLNAALRGLPPAVAADPDVHLMLAFRGGDERAFEQLILRNQSKVFSIIYRFIGERSEAEDLSQEVFLRVYRTAARYEPTAKFSTWLYRIAINVSLNAIRNRSRFQPLSLEIKRDDDEEFRREVADPAGPEPNSRMDGAELRQVVMSAIEQLPDQQRAAIILNKYEGLSYEQVSEILGCSVMAVKSLLSRARASLKIKLAPYLRR